MAHLLPFLLFSLVASITPGPTNILVLGHSARYGLRSALPLVAGGCVAASSRDLIGRWQYCCSLRRGWPRPCRAG